MSLSTVINYNSSAQFFTDASTVTITSSAALKSVLGVYSTANPYIDTQYNIVVAALSSFAESTSVSGSDAVKYQILVNGNPYYYDTVNTIWKLGAIGTYSQTNTASELNSHVSTLISSLGLSGSQYVSVVAYLHSNDGTTTPTLTSNTIGYTFIQATNAAINLNTISAGLRNLLGNIPYNAQMPTILYVKCDKTFLHGSRVVLPFTQTATFDANGNCSITVIETATPGVPLQFFLSFYENNSRKVVKFRPAVVPNQAGVSLNGITVVDTIDFG